MYFIVLKNIDTTMSIILSSIEMLYELTLLSNTVFNIQLYCIINYPLSQ